MHTIRGHRGNYLADAYRRKFAEGCQARFSFGLVGAHTKGHLGAKTARGRLPLRSTGFDYHPENNDNVKNNPDDKLDLTLDYYSHQKYLIIQGNYAGNPNAQPGLHRLLQLGCPRLGQRRDPGRGPGREVSPAST